MYSELQTELMQKRDSLEQRIEAIERDLKSQRSADFAEQTTERENDQVLEGILQEAKVEVQQIELALKRIEDNSYGICIKCEEQIDIKRLNALPYTTTCIQCAE